MLKCLARSISWARLTRPETFAFGEIQEFSREELTKAEKYVEETLRSRNWVTYMLASYLPKPLRPHFYTIHLLDLELIKIAENAREPQLALGKLDFWKKALFQVYNREKPQPEPLSICLHHAINNNPLTYGYFSRMVGVRAQEISQRSVETMAEMRQMADNSKGALLALTLELLRIDIGNEHVRRVIDYLGQAVGICEYLRRVPYSLRNNRFMLPQEILTKYNLTPKNIWDRVYGKPSEELFDGVLEIAAHAKKCYEMAVREYEEHRSLFPEHSFRAFLRGVETEYYLELLERHNFNLFDPALNNISPLKLPYRVYKAARAQHFSYSTSGKKQM